MPGGVSPCVEGIAENAAGRRIYEFKSDELNSDAPDCHPFASVTPREFGYLQAKEPVANLAGNLPHWRQEGVTYFVTFRLADSLPQVKLEEWLRERGAWLVAHPKPWDDATGIAYHRQFTTRIEKWLDAGHGSCMLARSDIRSIVANALPHFAGTRYWLDMWVIMPNHVHVVLTPLAGYELSKILHAWKSFTSHAIVKILPEWHGPFWQKESFDHIVRSRDQLDRFRVYIAENPRGLPADRFSLCPQAMLTEQLGDPNS
jgi:REP element-mobilizing transposase RayT